MSSSSQVMPSDSIRWMALRLRSRAGREPGHREAEDVGARQAEPVARLGRDDQRVGGVEAAGDADDDRRHPGRVAAADGAHPLLEPGHLDVVGLVAVEREAGLVVRHEGEAVDRAAQAEVAGRRAQLERHHAEAALVGGVGLGVVAEAALAQALLAQPVEVDVDDRAARARRGSARTRRAGRPSRRPSSCRPTTGRSTTHRRSRRRRGRRRCSGRWPSGRAGGGPRRGRR